METSVNNKCKAFTSLNQSKKLAEILPLESADGVLCEYDDGSWHYEEWVDKPATSRHEKICWSLAALLGILPYCTDLSKHTDGKWYITTYPNDVHTCLMAYNNPIDACYDMILKLHELKML